MASRNKLKEKCLALSKMAHTRVPCAVWKMREVVDLGLFFEMCPEESSHPFKLHVGTAKSWFAYSAQTKCLKCSS